MCNQYSQVVLFLHHRFLNLASMAEVTGMSASTLWRCVEKDSCMNSRTWAKVYAFMLDNCAHVIEFDEPSDIHGWYFAPETLKPFRWYEVLLVVGDKREKAMVCYVHLQKLVHVEFYDLDNYQGVEGAIQTLKPDMRRALCELSTKPANDDLERFSKVIE